MGRRTDADTLIRDESNCFCRQRPLKSVPFLRVWGRGAVGVSLRAPFPENLQLPARDPCQSQSHFLCPFHRCTQCGPKTDRDKHPGSRRARLPAATGGRPHPSSGREEGAGRPWWMCLRSSPRPYWCPLLWSGSPLGCPEWLRWTSFSCRTWRREALGPRTPKPII